MKELLSFLTSTTVLSRLCSARQDLTKIWFFVTDHTITFRPSLHRYRVIPKARYLRRVVPKVSEDKNVEVATGSEEVVVRLQVCWAV